MVILTGFTPEGVMAQLVQGVGSPQSYGIVVETETGVAVKVEVPIDPGKACVALEDAISEFRIACKLPRRFEQMGGNGKRSAYPVSAGHPGVEGMED